MSTTSTNGHQHGSKATMRAVVEVGSATEQFKVGDRVLIPSGHGAGFFNVKSTTVPEIPMYGAWVGLSPIWGAVKPSIYASKYTDDSLVALLDDFSSGLDWLFLSDIFLTA
ncbi:hypothetical protein B0H63DRAFT_468122 [Podospora didyma]|uniref:GroES-like protein n=1 Tax=Podospora didyma TaxID=330526 RepID=A0AAE0NSB8_9PEZI|nr:hypothetical protein B0H63DRAFT_468122 [Podospora didyma]